MGWGKVKQCIANIEWFLLFCFKQTTPMKSNFYQWRIVVLAAFLVISIPNNAQHFAIIGYYRNKTEATAQVAALVNGWNPDFVVTCGDNFDLTAGTIDDQVGQFYSEYIYPYKGSYSAGFDYNRFFPVIGNHELKENGLSLYLDYFTLPGNERYYDFVQGSVHFFMLNSNLSEPDGIASDTVQALWLKKQLELSASLWNIVVLHQAPYSSGSHGSDTTLQWPFFLWGADAVISGHDHQYERIGRDGITYFVNGLGGSSIYAFADTIAGSQKQFNSNFGAQRVFVTENELKFEFYTITDSLVDSFTLNRNSSAVFDHNFPDDGIVYPNPSDSYIRFTVPVTGVVVYNPLGQIVFKKQLNPFFDTEIAIDYLPNGLYFIHIEGHYGIRNTRFVKL
jgi:hypothetical protein